VTYNRVNLYPVRFKNRSKRKSIKYKKCLPSHTDLEPSQLSSLAFSAASKESMNEMGYVIEAIENCIVKIKRDGTQTIIHPIGKPANKSHGRKDYGFLLGPMVLEKVLESTPSDILF